MKNKNGKSLGHSLEVNIILRLNKTIKMNSSIKNDDKLLYELFPKIFEWNIHHEFDLRDTNDLNRVFYYSLRILQLEALRITELEQQINELKKNELAKTQEQTLLKKGIDLNKIKVNGVNYSEFHLETASAFLHIVSNLGIEYGKFISNPGVQNRPHAFVRDIKEIQKQGLSDPEQIWNELRKKTYTLYRKLSLPENVKEDILKNGMDSNFLRMNGNTYNLIADILKNGLNIYITNHIINARTQGSPLLSTTFSQDSATALNLAQQYSGYDKNNDVYTFALNVPIYDIIIANNLSNQSKLYEILIWNQVKSDRIGVARV